jgi:alpha-tubulin suppressor-like RCC1 family protein
MVPPCPVESRFRRLRSVLSRRWFWLAVFSVVSLLFVGQRAVWGTPLPDSGSILSWGSNAEGAFGDGQYRGRQNPAPVQRISVGLSSKTVKLVAAGPTHSVAVTTDNKIYTWGLNADGQLGTNDVEPRLLPTEINDQNSLLTGKVIVEVAVALGYTLVRTDDHKIFGWGRNDFGQLGTGSSSLRSTVPVATAMGGFGGKTLTRISCGGLHSLALTSEGNVFGWGYNSYGETGGAGYNVVNATPLLIGGVGTASARPVKDIAAGYYHSVGLLQDGSAYVWGYNYSGQFGNGVTQTKYTNVPQAVNNSGSACGQSGERN